MAEEIINNSGSENPENNTPEESGGNESFKPIETQEAFDAILKDRLERKERSIRKEYADYDAYRKKAEEYDKDVSKYSGQVDSLNAKIAELQGKIGKYETDSVKKGIADEFGLPPELADRLVGSDEKELRADAKELAKHFKRSTPRPNHEDAPNPNSEGLSLLRQLRGD